ncbi:MAG: PAS domain S-box protein [Desulfobacteraceae bacterium]|nr:PAS domain S-box protein [Desulfobacteraceae bacterium]
MVDTPHRSKKTPKETEYRYKELEQRINLRTAQLLETNRQLQREINDRKRAEQITRSLFRISNAVNTTKNLPELYVSIHRSLDEILELKNFLIALYFKERNTIYFPYFKDEFDLNLEHQEYLIESDTLAGEVIMSGRPLVINQKDLEQRAAASKLVGTIPKIWMGVPLKIKGEVIGVMATQSYDDPNCFDHMDLEILKTVSDQVALAIERKRSEQALKESEEKYRGILDNIEDGYYEVDPAGNFTLVNGALCKMLGYTVEELMGLNNRKFMDEKNARLIYGTFNTVYRTGMPAQALDWEFIRKDGAVRNVETAVSLIRDGEDQPIGFRGIARDVTERINAEKERKALESQLQQSQKLESLGTLAGGVAHDFNNLLMGIQGRASLMLMTTDETHPHHHQLKGIEEYVRSASALTTRLLGFARGGKYEVKPTDLNELVEKSIELFGRTKKEIAVTTVYDEHLHPVEVDANQIEQVLLNLFVNAWQAMPDGGKMLIRTRGVTVDDAEAQAYGIKTGEYARLTVADTGKGIEKEALARIFDPFFTTKSTGRGTGLGLAMVYGIVKNHSGAIYAESEPNRGATFTILLPSTRKAVHVESGQKDGIQQGDEGILLVDDEAMITEVGRDLLEKLGHTVWAAASGREAMDIYQHHAGAIDLVIIDMIMPHMSGGELFDRLKVLNPGIRVLLSSGYSINGQAVEIMNRGCDGFIQKPFNIIQLSVKIREILDS